MSTWPGYPQEQPAGHPTSQPARTHMAAPWRDIAVNQLGCPQPWYSDFVTRTASCSSCSRLPVCSLLLQLYTPLRKRRACTDTLIKLACKPGRLVCFWATSDIDSNRSFRCGAVAVAHSPSYMPISVSNPVATAASSWCRWRARSCQDVVNFSAGIDQQGQGCLL